ncbi:hypothetical protein Z517_02801 [Fonsecaea pedrosoi CBS 271.37]|uniref:Unplaced genomic scaffold supercont1.2, whole genome shotgun sequence n=1 Tax=Fonsecaea pedrosoi CBS 271.37 TaxID=1442368 RepID=A0A0D2E0L7_9EURO|nr:uncharacterized protein Z517_02801 [Fonsecaea pedrosoi CBS 271.37]KIW83556.1 hypothetical protein Z517_02801 [Fonsecaea pedrosoi CBS 271.37]
MIRIQTLLQRTEHKKIDEKNTPRRATTSRSPSRNTPDAEAQKAFNSAGKGNLHSDPKNNASLNTKTIAGLAEGIVSRDPKIVVPHFKATTTFIRAEYMLPSDIEPPVLKVTRNAHLGQVALQTDSSVFWVRDAMWIQVIAEHEPAEDFLEGYEYPTYRRLDSLVSDFLRDATTSMLLAFATKLDTHLEAHAVSPSKHEMPKTAVDRSSFNVDCGDSFSVKLCDASNTHESRWAEVQNPHLVLQTANKHPGTVREYSFCAINPGSTTLTLVVVRADNLAIGTARVQVEIVERRASEANEDSDVES